MNYTNSPRPYTFLIRLNASEMEQLTSQVEKSGITREAFVRKIIRQEKIYEPPPIEYHEMKRELYQIGNNLNQIARIANACQLIDREHYSKTAKDLDKMLQNLDQQIRAACTPSAKSITTTEMENKKKGVL